MTYNELSDYKFSTRSGYDLDEHNYIVAVKDKYFPDRNIVPLYYKSANSMILGIDEEDIGNTIFIKRGNDKITQDIETRFFENELFKIFRGPLLQNDRHEIDTNLPKKSIYKNKLQFLTPNEVIEIFEAEIDESKSRIYIKNEALRELIGNTYIRTNQVLFISNDDKQIGPFLVKRSDTGYFIVEKSLLLGNFGVYKLSNEDIIEIQINGINRKLIYDFESINKAFYSNFDFISDEEIISWFNNELTNKENELFNKEEISLLNKSLEKSISNEDLKKDTNRYKRLLDILAKTKDLIITKQNLLNLLPELNSVKEENESLERKGLELRNEIDKKNKEIEFIENKLFTKKEEISTLEKEIILFSEKGEEERKKIEMGIESKIKDLKKEAEELDENIKKEKETKSEELKLLREEITFQERRKNELETVIETLRKEFIEDQKKSHEKLVELVRHKTHFDFISGKDLSLNEDTNVNFKDFRIENDNFKSYKELSDGITEIFKKQYRHFTSHFIDNVLISIFQNSLTLFAGLPGTGKTSLAKIITSALTEQSRIKEIPIARGWTSQKDLIGFSNPISKNFYQAQTGLYKLLSQLNHEWETETYLESPLAFVLLDEANLSPMEHYWSTFYNTTDSYASKTKPLQIDLGQSEVIKYANSLRFIGTINYDQTTEELSPRILDRINIISIKPNQNQIDNYITEDISALQISFKKCIEFFGLPDFNEKNFDILMPEKLKDKYEEIKKIFEKLNIYISPRVEIGIKRYCQVANKIMPEEYRPLDYCIAQRLLPMINIQGDVKNELEELKNIIKTFRLEDSSATNILENIIQIGSKDGYTKDSYNYFLTLTHV